MMGRRSVQKGKRGEREAAAAIRRIFGTRARRGCQHHGREDAPDIVTGIVGVHFEVKRVEALHLYRALEQAVRDAGKNIPVVLHRRNQKPWVVIVRLEDLPLLAAEVHWTCMGRQPLKEPRRCLKCSRHFASEGPGNRICPRCRQENQCKYGNCTPQWIDRQRGRKFHNGEPLE